jgi:hypothetical protein
MPKLEVSFPRRANTPHGFADARPWKETESKEVKKSRLGPAATSPMTTKPDGGLSYLQAKAGPIAYPCRIKFMRFDVSVFHEINCERIVRLVFVSFRLTRQFEKPRPAAAIARGLGKRRSLNLVLMKRNHERRAKKYL